MKRGHTCKFIVFYTYMYRLNSRWGKTAIFDSINYPRTLGASVLFFIAYSKLPGFNFVWFFNEYLQGRDWAKEFRHSSFNYSFFSVLDNVVEKWVELFSPLEDYRMEKFGKKISTKIDVFIFGIFFFWISFQTSAHPSRPQSPSWLRLTSLMSRGANAVR